MQKDDHVDTRHDEPIEPSPTHGPGQAAHEEHVEPRAGAGGELFDDGDVVTISKTINLARCLGRGPSEMGAWQNELDFGRLVEAAVADRICLEMTARGYVPRVETEHDGNTIQCTYQGKGVWRVHQVVEEAGGDITKYETGTQHLLDLVPFETLVHGLRAYVGHLASKRVDGLREELEMVEERLAAL